ncbi:MAG: chemotaxis protein CheD [Gammaproteobacteria bacterium]|nr:chemotaxis protein CheD [Gammaproteobacteria bacterium]
MVQKILIVGEQDFSVIPQETLKTFALGSCLGIILLDPVVRAVGMLHAALPDSNLNPAKAAQKPGYFVDTGICYLLKLMSQEGCPPDGAGMLAKMAGGAAVLGQADLFNVGQRNIESARALLSRKGIKIISEDVGKHLSRTMAVNVGSAKVVLSSPGCDNWMI